jgi:acetoacetyl-CoA synthetase
VSLTVDQHSAHFFCSDGTLNPNGIRFGSAEIYSIIDQFSGEIADSLCVAQRNPATGNERVILFVKVSEHQSRDKR